MKANNVKGINEKYSGGKRGVQRKSHKRTFFGKLGKFLMKQPKFIHLRKPQNKNAGHKMVLIAVRVKFKTIE